MSSVFNGQILVDKLAKLNSSQQSIETLSHWCIFHRKNAKQVVETWDTQFHSSPRDQRVSFLYLANDILQNSRRKGLEFVTEFWKVLPGTLNDALENGDEFARSATMRLIDIWEERKVFGLRPQTLKEELLHRNTGTSFRNGRQMSSKSKVGGDSLEKIISGYGVVYDGPINEDPLFNKCRDAIGYIEKVGKDMTNSHTSGQVSGSNLSEELQGQNAILKDCIEQLVAAESSRESLISHLKKALNEQEMKLDQIRGQLMTARGCFEQANNICHQLANHSGGQVPSEQKPMQPPVFSGTSPVMDSETGNADREQTSSTMLIQTGPSADGIVQVDHDNRKTAAAVAARLASSTSSAQMLTYVLSSLASEGVISNPVSEGSADYSFEKKPRLEDGLSSSYVPPLPTQPRPPPVPHPDNLLHKVPTVFSHVQTTLSPSSLAPHANTSMLSAPPLPLTPPPAQPPPPPAQLAQPAGTMAGLSYNFGNTSLQAPLSGYSMIQYTPLNSYQNFHTTEGGYYKQPPMSTGPSISRQQNQV